MEIELINFKIEVEKRFSKSLITQFKFPRKSTKEESGTSPHNKSMNTDNFKEKNKTMLDRWKTIDNYYQK